MIILGFSNLVKKNFFVRNESKMNLILFDYIRTDNSVQTIFWNKETEQFRISDNSSRVKKALNMLEYVEMNRKVSGPSIYQ